MACQVVVVMEGSEAKSLDMGVIAEVPMEMGVDSEATLALDSKTRAERTASRNTMNSMKVFQAHPQLDERQSLRHMYPHNEK